MDYLKLTHEKLLIDDIMKLVSSEKCGAVSIFVGTTRDNFEDKQVVHLEYEAYDEMALKVMKELCKDIRDKWSEVHNIAIYHRLGIVPVLESSVVIAISSPHRVDSMAAVQYCIENLKEKNIFTPTLDLDEKKTDFNPQLIQINASNDEIERRMQNYIERKRQQINVCNVQDFIHSNTSSNCESSLEYDSCARVDAVLIKQKDSKGHLRVMKVKNEWGPQTKTKKFPISKGPELANSYLRGISERLENAEKHLSITTPIPKDVYDRLKRIEDRILELESLSPEYVSFWGENKSINSEGEFNSGEQNVPKKLKYNSDDILKKINAMKHN